MIDERNLWEFGSLRSDLKIETVNVPAPPILHLVTPKGLTAVQYLHSLQLTLASFNNFDILH
jgi:hypothetical protein